MILLLGVWRTQEYSKSVCVYLKSISSQFRGEGVEENKSETEMDKVVLEVRRFLWLFFFFPEQVKYILMFLC